MRSNLRTLLLSATALGATSVLSWGETDSIEDRAAVFLKAFSSVGEHFESNIGQMGGDVLYAFRKDGYRLELLQEGVRLAMPQLESDGLENMQIQFRGACGEAIANGVNPLPFQVMQRPVKNGVRQALQPVSTFGSVMIESVYEGVNVHYRVNEGRVQFDFIVEPGADPSRIRLGMNGADQVAIDGEGDLLVRFQSAELRQSKPYVFQNVEGRELPVDGSYFLGADDSVQFALGSYDNSLPLIIDPILTVVPKTKIKDLAE
jgi:hypothetical protein